MTISCEENERPVPSQHHRLYARAISEHLLEIPVEQLKRIAHTKGVNSIERETKHFSYTTTLHGPLRLYQGKGFGKVFWGLVMAAAFVFLSLQINILVADYLSHPTTTSVTFVVKDALPLPAITICNYNPIKKEYVRYLNESSSGKGLFTHNLLRYMIIAYTQVEDLYLHANNESLELGKRDYEIFEKAFTEYKFNIENFFAHSGFTCSEMLKACSLGGYEIDCCRMSKRILTDLGWCFTFSVGETTIKQRLPGIFNGLQVILDAGLNETVDISYIKGGAIPIFSNNIENGFRIYVRNGDELAYSSTEGLTLSPSYRAYVALSLQQFHFLSPDQWGNCTDQWPPGSPLRAHQLPYTAQNCASLCQQVYYEEKINCTPMLYSVGDASLATCTPSELHDFMLEVMDRSNNINGPECEDNICPTSCITYKYSSSISYGQGFSDSALNWLQTINSDWTKERVETNFAVLNVFYREMSYILNQQVQSTSLVNVLSNIGGNMGMFFGASVITVIELVIYFSKMCWIVISRKRREYMARKKKNELEREQRLRAVLENAAAKTTAPNYPSHPHYENPTFHLGDDVEKKPIFTIDECYEPSTDSDEEDTTGDVRMRHNAHRRHNITIRDRASSSNNYVNNHIDPASFDHYYFNDDEIVAQKDLESAIDGDRK
ncbi:Acid-sensing ion channel 4 [Toxocara canis]|nr:Acid-sensing ion channel 4 [Toxocara canis]